VCFTVRTHRRWAMWSRWTSTPPQSLWRRRYDFAEVAELLLFITFKCNLHYISFVCRLATWRRWTSTPAANMCRQYAGLCCLAFCNLCVARRVVHYTPTCGRSWATAVLIITLHIHCAQVGYVEQMDIHSCCWHANVCWLACCKPCMLTSAGWHPANLALR
jgi:hypothetical protein